MKTSVHDLLEKHFETAFAAPDGIAKLRELILTLAMRGKLVEQDTNDPPASELLREIEKEKASHEDTKARRGKKKKLPPIKPEEVPYQLPRGWEWVRLGALTSYNFGKTPASKNPIYWSETDGYHWASISDMPTRGYLEETSKKVTEKAISDVFKHEPVPAGSLLMSFKLSIGKTAITKIDTFHNEAIISFVHLDDRLKMYLYWILNKLANSGNTKGAIKGRTLNSKSISELLIPLPPLPEQRRIVERIDQLMARCDELEKLRKAREEKRLAIHNAAIKRLLEAKDGAAWDFIQKHFGELYTVKENVAELRKAILQLAVMGRLVPQDPNDPPASELLKEIEAEKQRLIKEGKIKKPKPLPPIKPEEVPYQLPQGWEWVRLGDVGLVGSSSRVHQRDWKDQGVPFYRAREIVKLSKLGFVDNELYISEDHYQALAKDGLVPEVNDVMLTGVGTIGVPYIVKETDRFYFKDASVLIFKNYYRLYAPYLYWFFKSPYWIDRIHDGSMGTTVHTLTIGRANDIVVPLPPLPEQHRIVEHIDQLMALCDKLEQQIDAATGKQTELLNAVMVQM